MLEIETTSDGRRPQNIKSGIIQKPLPPVLNSQEPSKKVSLNTFILSIMIYI
jgi:hypothetical protein